MRGKRSSGYWGIGSEFDNWVDGRCVACLGRRAGRVGEMMLNSLWDGAEDCDIRALGMVDRARDRRTRRQSILG